MASRFSHLTAHAVLTLALSAVPASAQEDSGTTGASGATGGASTMGRNATDADDGGFDMGWLGLLGLVGLAGLMRKNRHDNVATTTSRH